ncbi:hypothetical protein L9F63_018177 [Diploptera punctata]|uniref:Uncharacterized protein n=1 Tax=Diploptera punctata TaxID=6984 RepID=A0AAD7ZX77_DIPPU|nr:hypothetical protein L9F63_018177 [Diploptera punctata]
MSTKSPASYKVHRSLSASAVALSQLQQPVQTYEIPPGSHSESEAWSEPDRTVSLARIGLNEESTKSMLLPGSLNGCTPSGATRSRSGRILQDDDNSSESSEQTAHEIRIHGKRSRSDNGETKRLQNRLKALEQVNEALRAELAILHQLTPPHSLPSTTAETNDKPITRDMSINTTQDASEEKFDKSTSVEPLKSQDGTSCSSVTISVHLLEQIRYQREKLESSLFHNDFIRLRLEEIINSLNSQDGDNIMNLWQKTKETSEQLEEAQQQSQEFERKLQEMEIQLKESKEQARLADAANEQLQITRQTVSLLQEQITTLEVRLQEKDNEILERKCHLLELENQVKQQGVEAENVMQEAKKLKEEAELQLKTAENIKFAEETKMKEAEKLIIEAEKMKFDINNRMKDLEKRLKDVELQLQDIEIQRSKLQFEKDIIEKEKARLLDDKETIKKEKESVQLEKELGFKERITIQKEWEKLKDEKEAMKKELDTLKKEVFVLTGSANKQKEEAENQMQEARRKIEEAEIQKKEAEVKIKSAKDEIILIKKQSEIALEEQAKELKMKFNEKLQEAEKKLQQQEWINRSEVQKKICEAERLGLEFSMGLKSQIEEAQRQEREVRQEAERKIKEIQEINKVCEAELKRRLQECEKCCREKECELIKHLDETKLINSQAALERIRLANEKLHLEQEIRRHEAREAELICEKKEAENRLLVSKEQLEKEMGVLQQQKNDLEKCVKELETANKELRKRLQSLHINEHLSTSSNGPDSTSSLMYVRQGRTSPGSYSSGLDLNTGEGSSLPSSPWGPTGPVSLECMGSKNDDKEHSRDRSRRSSDGGRTGGFATLSNMMLQQGFGRQRSELSDYMSEDQAQEYEAVFTQTCSSRYWVTTLTEQHSTPSSNAAVDPSLIRNINSSPDLGIESDQGRFSSLEAASSGMQADTTKVVSTMEGYGSDLDHTLAPVVINSRCDASMRSYKELEQENIVLRRRLTKTFHILEETQAQLTAATQRKKQVERAICKQLHKTHHILKKARINLDAGTDYISTSTQELE